MTESLDPRMAVFCSPAGAEAFRSVAQAGDVWRGDPYDLPELHAEARAVFEQLIDFPRDTEHPPPGRILLLLGESGAGKTHLMRAFRNRLHHAGKGCAAYMQMTTGVEDYARYILSKTLDSLERPYLASSPQYSALDRLSDRLVTDFDIFSEKLLKTYRQGRRFTHGQLAEATSALAARLSPQERLAGLPLDLLRVMIYLQREDSRARNRALRVLRGVELSKMEREILGGTWQTREAGELLSWLGHLTWATQNGPLVLCLDQLENIYDMREAEHRFRQAIATLTSLADQIPGVVFVVGCLDDLYRQFKPNLTRSFVDRLERDPAPVTLANQCNREQVKRLVSRRLETLYTQHQVAWDGDDPLYPFSQQRLEQLGGMRVRDVLHHCQEWRQYAVRHGELPESPPIEGQPAETDSPPSRENLALDEAWNDWLVENEEAPPEDDEDLLKRLADFLEQASEEQGGEPLDPRVNPEQKEIILDRPGHPGLLIGLCQKAPQGGHLARQLRALRERAGSRIPVAVRAAPFTRTSTSQIARELEHLRQRGGEGIVLEEADWRRIQGWREFRRQHGGRPEFSAWQRETRPLSQLPAPGQILVLLEQAVVVDSPVQAEPPPPRPSPRPAPASPTALDLGLTGGLQAEPLFLDPADLIQHLGLLGGTGSGKTTLALNLIEQLLSQGIPAILLDRKGDLCAHADPAAWEAPLADPSREAERAALREKIEVTLYTPGNSQGRALSVPLVPREVNELEGEEKQNYLRQAAFSLGGMMNYKPQGADAARLAILGQALGLLAESGAEISLSNLIELVDSREPALVEAIGRLDTKHFRKLVDDLETLRLNSGYLLSAGQDEVFHVDELLRARDPNKTRLTIISTRFLGEQANLMFWMGQFLLEMNRYCRLHPSDQLQAVVLFDEADRYLPAVSKPPTKEPMLEGLKRFRSAGIGMMLASQSPGDFDYKSKDNIKSWFLGRIHQPTALQNMRPLWGGHAEVPERLPAQSAGEFHFLQEGRVHFLKGRPALFMPRQLGEHEILALAGEQPARHDEGQNADG